MNREEIKDYIHSVVEVVIQLKRGEKGRRFVSEVYFGYANKKKQGA
jgi:type IV secretion system protein VirB11